jgi:repressor LexA
MVDFPLFFAENQLGDHRMALTKRQKEVLDLISTFVEAHGYSPSFEELAVSLGLASLATVHKHILALEAKSYLKRSYNQSRSIELTPKYFEERRRYEPANRISMAIPLLGRIAAGSPVESFSQQGSIDFADFAGNPDTYGLEVRGESMIEDHICSGDYVLVQKTDRVRDGEIVVALIDGSETTLKRFYDEGEMVRLQPANSAMEPIRVPKSTLQIQGKVLAVLRKYR